MIRKQTAAIAALILSLAAPFLAAQAESGSPEAAPAAAPAKGSKKGAPQAAEGLENWKASIDLSAYPPGKYNLVVQGRDKAGNLTEYPPFNLYVDPASDLPLATIVNPTPLLRVGGDLNIVGTCQDDDAVARVEVSLDGGEFLAAEGTEFWSLYLRTEAVPDGRRSLEARGVDANGLVGPSVRVAFDLDRAKPLVEVSSPPAGSLAAGQLAIEGSVFDLNGPASLEASLDGGQSYEEVELRASKDPARASFSYELDTRELPDGPFVLWFRSVDGVGSEAKAAFLVFVDNTKPLIELARPAAGQAVNGRFSVAGAARDAVGIKRLTYSLAGSPPAEIPLTKGDPYFAVELDAGAVKGDKAELVLTAEDRIGNLTRLALAPRIDRRADLPRLRLAAPLAEGGLRAGEPVWGSIEDDDGAAALRWSLDGGPPTEIPCSETFGFFLPEATASGRHVLSLVPVDLHGAAGDKVSAAFSYDRGPGAVSFTSVSGPKGSRPFVPGVELALDGGESVEGSIASANVLVSLEYAVGDGPAKALPAKAEGGSYPFRVPVDASFPYGFSSLALRAKDGAGNYLEGRSLVYATNYGAVREESGFRFVDPRMPAVEPGAAPGREPARVDFGSGGDILGAFYREELASLSLVPDEGLVEASFEGMALRLAPRREGLSAPTRLVARTKRGHEFSAGPFVFATDAAGPSVALAGPAEGSWFRGEIEVSGSASDPGGLASVAYRVLPGGASVPLRPKADGAFSFKLAAAELPPGPFSIEVEARDAAGNAARAYRGLGADAEPPRIRFPGLEGGAEAWGPEDILGLVEEASGIASVEYAEDGRSFAPIEWRPGFFVHRADLAAHPGAAYRVTDLAGNAATARPELRIVAAPARTPRSSSISAEAAAGEGRVELAGASGGRQLSLALPALGEAAFAALGFSEGKVPPERLATRLLVSGPLSLKGQASAPAEGGSPLKSVSASFDGGSSYQGLALVKDEKSAKATLAFSLPVPAAALKEGEARWLLKLEDFAGAAFLCPIYALVDLSPPSLSIVYPGAEAAAMPGPFPLLARIEDPVGLASAELAQGASKEALDVGAGGRFFVRLLDPASAPKGAPLAIQLQARDEAGNAASAARKLAYDQAKDLPAASLAELPAPCRAGQTISGSASDDDGPPELSVSVDGRELGSFPGGAFALALPALEPGKRRLLVSATDREGRRSELARELLVVAAPPAFGKLELGDPKSRSPWSPGAAFALGPGSSLYGSVSAPNGLASVELSIDGGPPAKATLAKAGAPGAETGFSLALPPGLGYSSHVLGLKALDLAGLASEARFEIHKILPSSLPADDAEELRFVDSRIEAGGAGGAGGAKAGSFLLAPGEAIEGRFNGRPIAELSLKPAAAQLKAGFEGPLVKLEAAAEGLAEGVELVARTVDGDLFAWGPFSARVDAAPPLLEISAPADHEWRSGRVRVAGSASDPQGIAALELSVNGGAPLSLLEAGAARRGPALFDREIDLSSAPEGSVRLEFTARDGAGRASRALRFVNKDSLPPELAQILPAPGEAVNGTMTVVLEAKDGGRLASASFLAAADPKAEADPAAAEVRGLALAAKTLDFARLQLPLAEGSGFVFADKAGNRAILAPDLVVDREKDKPVAEIHAPIELEVQRGDFAISGVAYDDDGLAAAYYRIDGGEWRKLPMEGTSFSVPILLAETSDNEHLVEAKAEDIYGVQGDLVARRFRVSKEEPVARMTEPPIAKPSRGVVELVGTASDANGVESVSISLDSRASYNQPVGAESWRYRLDTRALADGLHPVAVKPIDKYGTEGFYASLVYVDNSPPSAFIDLPLDGEVRYRDLLVSGRVSDNMALASSRIEIAPVGRGSPPLLVQELGVEGIVRRRIDLSSLEPGPYTLRIVARDRADNESLASRDIVLAGGRSPDRIELLYPLEGSSLGGRLVVYGKAAIAGPAGAGGPAFAGEISLASGGAALGSAKPDELGYFAIAVPPEALPEGELSLVASAADAEGRRIESRPLRASWKRLGPWITIDTFPAGAYLPYRPYLEGRAGIAADPPDPADKAAAAAFKKAAKEREPVAVELSFDNGRSFVPASGGAAWKLRLETQDYPEGGLYLIARARFGDGSEATAKTLLFLDKTRPELAVAAPFENGRYNGLLSVSGTASDENGLDEVTVSLRKGDKKSYALPSFIQGLYADARFLGATSWAAGLGLTFFDDNVKLQGSLGSAPEEDGEGNQQRFFGSVYAARLIANIGLLPFGALFGPDWDFLSASLGLGADFSYFSESQSGGGLIVSAVFAQIEFPKLTKGDWKAFKSLSFYTEFQVWVVSSDVEGGFVPRLSLGTRLGIF